MSASQLLISGIAERGHHRRALSSILLKSGKVKGVLYIRRKKSGRVPRRLVFVGFADDRRLVGLVFVLFVFVLIIIVVVGISRRCCLAYVGGESARYDLPTSVPDVSETPPGKSSCRPLDVNFCRLGAFTRA